MKQSTNSAHVINVQLSDIDKVPVNVKYQDEELVIIDDLRYIPDFAARKIAFNIGIMCLTGKLQFEIGGRSLLKKIRRITGWVNDEPRICNGEYLPMHQAIRFDLMSASPTVIPS